MTNKLRIAVIVALLAFHLLAIGCAIEGGVDRPSSPCIGNCSYP